ncbi:formate dehydrogenase accessory protein FdhE [Proteus vulgaris]|nr:formate dehydrogenase accessory protein FdhE [Proteus vulgaris]
MSIRIVPKEQLGKEQSEKGISFIPPSYSLI